MTTKYPPTDILPYTIECNVCAARFQRMIDYEEHEPTHNVVASVEDPNHGSSLTNDEASVVDDRLSETLVFHFGAPEEGPPARAASDEPVQTDELPKSSSNEAEDTASPAPVGRVRLPRHVRARGKYIPRVPTPTDEDPLQCEWTNCNDSFVGDDATQELYDHLLEHVRGGQYPVRCEWHGCTAKPQRDFFYARIHLQKHADIGGCLDCSRGCGEKFYTAPQRTAHHKKCSAALNRDGNN